MVSCLLGLIFSGNTELCQRAMSHLTIWQFPAVNCKKGQNETVNFSERTSF